MKPLMIALALGIVMVLAGFGWLHYSMSRLIEVGPDGRVFELAPGANVNTVALALEQEGIVSTPPIAFRIYARLTDSRGFVKAGEYRLRPGLSTADLLALFRSGDVVARTVTFPEGWTFRQWRAEIGRTDGIEVTLAGVSNDEIMAQLGKPDVAAEGQFFPDTYQYTKGESDIAILERAHRRMVQALEAEWQRRQPAAVIESPYDALILASIVEKETGYEPDRTLIAGVFINRLNAGMRLQSDPTVIYGIDDFDGDLRRADLRRPTPFNTYVISGLPPTPICNPGLASIRAVMNPKPSSYYYFVSRGDGRSRFSVTLEEHNEAVARYQKGDRVEH
ncbi:MAG: endolytic transglycosylase MltG [Gammaproteobacteria bacterium]|nr:endolytic transglycosylase MltG [Gammaproteobacteria bacterium]